MVQPAQARFLTVADQHLADSAARRDSPPAAEPTRSTADVVTGVIFAVIGVAFLIVSRSYGFGTLRQLGAGSFPAALAVLLIVFGVGIALRGLVRGEGGDFGRVPWRILALVVAAPLAFAATITGLGLGPAVWCAAFLAGCADRATGLRRVLVAATGVTAMVWVVFVLALQQHIDFLGDWLPF